MFTERFGAQVPVEQFEDKALVKGAIMELDENGAVKTEGEPIQVIDGIVAPWRFASKEEAAKFEGKKVGDKVVFNPWNTCEGNAIELASMLHIDKERAAEVKGNFEIAISEMIGLKPAEHNEEFYKNVFGDSVTTEEQYQEMLRNNISAQLMPNSSALFQHDAREILMARFGEFVLPAEFLKKWLIRQNDGLTAENIDEEYAKMESSIKWQLLKERIAAKAEVKIAEDDLLNYATHIAARQFAQYGMTNMDQETLTAYAKNLLSDKQYRPHIVEQVGDAKLFEAIHNAVTVDEQTVSLDRFKELAEQAK
ncbi:MAG: trigger factor, partial [Muribaculaceae bacterium]|nr:trigger factor [Muribaculaceae bacterium]